MKRRTRILLIGTACIIGAGVAATLMAKPWIATQLVQALEAQGFKNVKLTVSYLGFQGVMLENISIGDETPLSLKNVAVDYSLTDLRAKKVGGLTVEGLTLTGYQTDDGWSIWGLESLLEKSSGEVATTIPVTRQALLAIPLTSLTVKDSNFVMDTGKLGVALPLELTWRMNPKPTLHYEAANWNIKQGEMAFAGGALKIDATLEEEPNRWDGKWSIDGITVEGAPMPLPPLNAKGTLLAEPTRVVFKGDAADAKKQYYGTFELVYDLADKNGSLLRITDLRLPWNDGMVGVDSARLPLGSKRTTHFTLAVEKVSIAALMKSLTGEKATGTGLVSGTVPVTIGADGKWILHEGSLKAEEPGVIAIAPEVIPGDNAQVVLVRDVLKNLHYSTLSIAVDSGDDRKLKVLLAVEGKNPDVAGGRPVRLNVHLNGDVLNLIEQNVMAISDPTQLLEQGK